MGSGLVLGLAALTSTAALAADEPPVANEAVVAVEAASAPEEPPAPPSLAEAIGLPGVSPRLDLTGFVQAQVAGDGDQSARFTGRSDLFVDVSSDGLGLWSGTLLRTHTELRASDDGAARFGGGLWPQNTAAILPLTGQGVELTSFYVVQKLGAKTNLLAGKINMIDLLAADPFFGGWGTKRFQNLAFVAPPSGVVPPTIMGAMLTQQVGKVTLTAMVFDPEDRSGDYGIGDLFETGVNASLGATWRGAIAGRSTSIGITATGSTADGIDFENFLAPPDLVTGTREGSYNVAIQIGHDLHGSATGPSQTGVYAKVAIADGNPNLIQSSILGGVTGRGILAGRPRDRFGVGAYFYNFSDTLQDVTAPLVRFDDETGLEAWYAIALTTNADLTLNAQLIDPAAGANDTAVLLGARLGVNF